MCKIKLLEKPSNIRGLAVSGGIDSMVCLSFLLKARHKPIVFHYHHGTEHGEEAAEFVRDFCKQNNLVCAYGESQGTRQPGISPEEWWRKQRYRFFHSQNVDIATCHHLNDQAETWLFYATRGEPKLIPYRNKNVIRPFLLNTKETLVKWARKNGVPYVEDDSNKHLRYSRCRIRHRIMPEILKVSPGFLTTIRRLTEKEIQ